MASNCNFTPGAGLSGERHGEGVGYVHVPTLPRRHARYIRNFRPISNNLWIEFLGWLRGKKDEHIDAPKTLVKAEGREATRVRAMELLRSCSK